MGDACCKFSCCVARGRPSTENSWWLNEWASSIFKRGMFNHMLYLSLLVCLSYIISLHVSTASCCSKRNSSNIRLFYYISRNHCIFCVLIFLFFIFSAIILEWNKKGGRWCRCAFHWIWVTWYIGWFQSSEVKGWYHTAHPLTSKYYVLYRMRLLMANRCNWADYYYYYYIYLFIFFSSWHHHAIWYNS